ncbi:EKA-like protein [Blumeria hordei DH14]|uniref:EKA-like protein n=1 Tax=Blumeria graminis f. sp. hordei (strain DH14) TaxID=546991 RepID=N1JFM2_BLUG1|nr:EKA-like protein [Blumeria hordei DH14]
MPPVRKKRPNVLLDNTRVRPRALEDNLALEEKSPPRHNEPDTDMIGSVEIVEESAQPSSFPHGIGESSKSPPTASKPSENPTSKPASISTSQPKAATKADCPPELRPIVEAEQRRAAETAANLALYSAAIAQYMATATGTTPPVLPPRPANPPPRAPDARSPIVPAVPALPVKNTWATVAKNGLPQKVVPIVRAVPRPAAKAQKKEAPKAKVDKRLIRRLEKEHPWRKLSPSAIRQQIQEGLQFTLSDACYIH